VIGNQVIWEHGFGIPSGDKFREWVFVIRDSAFVIRKKRIGNEYLTRMFAPAGDKIRSAERRRNE